MSNHTNDESLNQYGKAMQAAWARLKRAEAKLWSEWMTIGDGLLEGRRWAMRIAGAERPEGKGYNTAFAEWLKRYHVDDMDKSDRAKLLQIMEERPAVEEWRATLTATERRHLNNPVIVWRKWSAANRVKKPKSRTAGFSASEMGRARDHIEQQSERIAELEQELATAKETTVAKLEAYIAELEGYIAKLEAELEKAGLTVPARDPITA